MIHTTLTQVKVNKWEDNKGNYIWKDDFCNFVVSVNGTTEIASSLEKALEIMDCDRYWN